MAQFKAVKHRGFQMEFANGWTVSVLFGVYDYCANHYGVAPTDGNDLICPNAEVGIFQKRHDGLFCHPVFEGDSVGQYLTPKQVLDLMIWAESLSPELTYDDLYKQFEAKENNEHP